MPPPQPDAELLGRWLYENFARIRGKWDNVTEATRKRYRQDALQFAALCVRAQVGEPREPPEPTVHLYGDRREDAIEQAIGLILSAGADLPSDATGGPCTQFKLALAIKAVRALSGGGPPHEREGK